ncbi:MAG: hypothetical protein AABZ13_01310, partial [Planctomycetota bacterium]
GVRLNLMQKWNLFARLEIEYLPGFHVTEAFYYPSVLLPISSQVNLVPKQGNAISQIKKHRGATFFFMVVTYRRSNSY